MVDLRSEKVLGLAEAGRLLPPGRRGPVTASCVLRWITKGLLLPSGERVRLEGVRIGRWLTSVEALQRFAARQTPDLVEESVPLPRSVDERQRASDAAARALDEMGI
jgi:hypothetical protein